ncbi:MULTISPECIES: DUF2630 family protein [unclassified Pseudonocardia]|jgi:hypothetical protein|uniref:DUF2630 family protein n=1 Tax=unclassified Pseudonocardia TaxID=2619320 RepID=UPI0031016E6F
MADDRDIRHHISELVEEEHRLERAHIGKPLSEEEQARLQRISVELDRLWDLLRQRDARRAAGEDPDAAQERDPAVVENYRQ